MLLGLKVKNSTSRGVRCYEKLEQIKVASITEIAGLSDAEKAHVIKYLDEDKRFRHVNDPAYVFGLGLCVGAC